MTVVKASDLPLLDADQVAALLNIPVATVRQLAREGRLPSIRIGRRVRFSRDAVVAAVTRAAEEGRRL